MEGDRGCWKTFLSGQDAESKLCEEENGAGVGGEAGWDSPGPQCSASLMENTCTKVIHQRGPASPRNSPSQNPVTSSHHTVYTGLPNSYGTPS